jgi:hypothetical protein
VTFLEKGHPKNFYLRGAGAKVPADGLEAALPEIPDAIFDLQDQLR